MSSYVVDSWEELACDDIQIPISILDKKDFGVALDEVLENQSKKRDVEWHKQIEAEWDNEDQIPDDLVDVELENKNEKREDSNDNKEYLRYIENIKPKYDDLVYNIRKADCTIEKVNDELSRLLIYLNGKVDQSKSRSKANYPKTYLNTYPTLKEIKINEINRLKDEQNNLLLQYNSDLEEKLKRLIIDWRRDWIYKYIVATPYTKPVQKKTKMCTAVINGFECKYGDECTFAHKLEEWDPRQCKNDDECTKGEKCPFIHSNEKIEQYYEKVHGKEYSKTESDIDVKNKTNKTKTRMCTAIINEFQCNYGNNCTFAHNLEEWNPTKCKNDRKCTKGNECLFYHSNEKIEQYYKKVYGKEYIKTVIQDDKIGDNVNIKFEVEIQIEEKVEKIVDSKVEKSKIVDSKVEKIEKVVEVIKSKTRMCVSVIKGITCIYASKCTFAHTMEEWCPIMCKYDQKCRNGKQCIFKHSSETKKEYFKRTTQ